MFKVQEDSHVEGETFYTVSDLTMRREELALESIRRYSIFHRL